MAYRLLSHTALLTTLVVSGVKSQEVLSHNTTAKNQETTELQVVAQAMQRRQDATSTTSSDITATFAARTAAAVAEAYSAKEEANSLRQKVMALGLTGLTGETKELQIRLVAAIGDLRLERQRSAQLGSQLLKLSEAAIINTSSPQGVTPESQINLQVEATRAQHLLQPPLPTNSIENEVVSASPERHLVIVNGGQTSGIKVGTPVSIYRGDRPVASALVVEVRRSHAAALVSSAQEDFPQVGDTTRVEALKN